VVRYGASVNRLGDFVQLSRLFLRRTCICPEETEPDRQEADAGRDVVGWGDRPRRDQAENVYVRNAVTRCRMSVGKPAISRRVQNVELK
jgi:hypothetical protein